MKSITKDQIMALNTDNSVIVAMIGDGPWELDEILGSEAIHAADRLFLVLHEEFIPARGLSELSCRYAKWALDSHRIWESIRVQSLWDKGEATDDRLIVAQENDAVATAVATAVAYAAVNSVVNQGCTGKLSRDAACSSAFVAWRAGISRAAFWDAALVEAKKFIKPDWIKREKEHA